MAVPDKIFMPNELLSEEWERHIEGQDIEYIRKDAILEWATEKIRPIANEKDDYYVGKRVAFKQVIEKILSL